MHSLAMATILEQVLGTQGHGEILALLIFTLLALLTVKLLSAAADVLATAVQGMVDLVIKVFLPIFVIFVVLALLIAIS